MQRVLKAFFLLTALSLTVQSAWADKYSDALDSFQKAGESGAFFGKAYGYALFPSIGKAGMGIGGAHGEGQVYRGGKHVGNSKMTQVTVGFQLGGQVYSQIIFFEDERAFTEFTSGNFEFGAQATAVAITAGASAQTSTGGGTSGGVSGGTKNAETASAGFHKGMAIFTIAKGGLMYEATLGGQKFSYTPL